MNSDQELLSHRLSDVAGDESLDEKGIDSAWLVLLEEYWNNIDRNLSFFDDEGCGLIHWAAELILPNSIAWLVAKGVDVNQITHDGTTALHFAVDAEFDTRVQQNLELDFSTSALLISLGANPHLKRTNGRSAFSMIRSYGATAMRKFSDQTDTDLASFKD